jgi:hypothetical protein
LVDAGFATHIDDKAALVKEAKSKAAVKETATAAAPAKAEKAKK